MENTTRYQNYKDFFPFYLREHSKKSTRLLHYFGTLGYQVLFWSLLVTQNYIFLPLILKSFFEKMLSKYLPNNWLPNIKYNKQNTNANIAKIPIPDL